MYRETVHYHPEEPMDMTANKFFDTSVQKAFMPTTPGCTEHHLKLATILGDARKKHKSLAVCWLDLANAYGSVHTHSSALHWSTTVHLPSLRP